MGRVGAITSALLAQVKASVKLNELQAPDGAVAMNSQKLSGLAAGTAQNDSMRKGQAEVVLADLVPAVCSETEADTKVAIVIAVIAQEATLADFQANAATGTVTTPANLNNNNTGDAIVGDAIGEYVEVAFGKFVKIDQWRQFGHSSQNGDGRWKMEYKGTDGDWHAWVASISAYTTTGWDSMQSESEVIASAIRLTVLVVDTGVPGSYFCEFEVYHS